MRSRCATAHSSHFLVGGCGRGITHFCDTNGRPSKSRILLLTGRFPGITEVRKSPLVLPPRLGFLDVVRIAFPEKRRWSELELAQRDIFCKKKWFPRAGAMNGKHYPVPIKKTMGCPTRGSILELWLKKSQPGTALGKAVAILLAGHRQKEHLCAVRRSSGKRCKQKRRRLGN